ncbi:hypothetical protein BVX94_01070 [bacterium B17]|nr:hypothetical protein BVX94_01070 [bacterium B17]
MKKVAIISLILITAAASMAAESTVSLSADLASAYVFRGSTFNDGAVIQPGMEVSGLPVTIGVWGNLDLDDYNDSLEGGEFSEIDIYASYDLPLEMEMLGLSVGYCEYTYPSGGGDADREVSLSAALDTVLAPSLAINYGIDGGIDEALYAELGLEHGVDLCESISLSLGAALGYLDPETGDSGFTHADISASLSYGMVSAGVTYIAQIDDDLLADVEDGGSYDADVVGTVGIAYEF